MASHNRIYNADMALEQMERDCAMEFTRERAERRGRGGPHRSRWLNTRLRILGRKADMLGYDAPKRHIIEEEDEELPEIVYQQDVDLLDDPDVINGEARRLNDGSGEEASSS